MHRSELLFLLLAGASKCIFLCAAGGDFDSLVAEYKKKRGEAVAKFEVLKQQYLGKVDGILVATGSKLHQTEESMSNCLATARSQFGMGSSQYQERALKCLGEFDKKTSEYWLANSANVDKVRAELQKNLQQFEVVVDDQLVTLRDKSGGDSKLNDAQRIELQMLEEEQEDTKMENARMLRSFVAEFSDDTVCIDIDNVGKELDLDRSLELAKEIIPYLSQDLTDLGTDYYISELSPVNQTLDYNVSTGVVTGQQEENGRMLRNPSYDTRHMMTTPKARLLTQWNVKIRFHRAITSLDISSNCSVSEDCYRRDLASAATTKGQNSVFERWLEDDGTIIEEFRLTERAVQDIFESRLMDMKDLVTEETTVRARSCGAWPLKDPAIVTINPVQLKDFVEFKQAHARIAEREKKETEKYEEKVERKYVEFRHELSNQELEYMSCLNHCDERLIKGEISLEERKISYDKCFEMHDSQDNEIRADYIGIVQKYKEPFTKRIDDLDKKMSAVKQKLDEEEAQFASKYLEEIAKEKEEQMKTMQQIFEEQRKIKLKLERGIVCEIDGLKRIFLENEISILEGLIERGANFAFNMCDIDLHVCETKFLDQEFGGRRLQRDDSELIRRLGSRLTIRFDSKWGCTKCTECSAYSDSSGSTSCGSCCLRRRLSADDIFNHEQIPDCFDTYLTPRVKKLIEVRLKSAMEDGRDEVYLQCSTFDESTDGEQKEPGI